LSEDSSSTTKARRKNTKDGKKISRIVFSDNENMKAKVKGKGKGIGKKSSSVTKQTKA